MNEQVPGHVTSTCSRAYRSSLPAQPLFLSVSLSDTHWCTNQCHVCWQLVYYGTLSLAQPAAYHRQTRLTACISIPTKTAQNAALNTPVSSYSSIINDRRVRGGSTGGLEASNTIELMLYNWIVIRNSFHSVTRTAPLATRWLLHYNIPYLFDHISCV